MAQTTDCRVGRHNTIGFNGKDNVLSNTANTTKERGGAGYYFCSVSGKDGPDQSAQPVPEIGTVVPLLAS